MVFIHEKLRKLPLFIRIHFAFSRRTLHSQGWENQRPIMYHEKCAANKWFRKGDKSQFQTTGQASQNLDVIHISFSFFFFIIFLNGHEVCGVVVHVGIAEGMWCLIRKCVSATFKFESTTSLLKPPFSYTSKRISSLL